MALTVERFDGPDITDEMLESAAQLFSSNYGVWGPLARTYMGSFAKKGSRVRMSASRLKEQCLASAPGASNIYVRVKMDDKLAGNVFATRWDYEERSMCWITQLCVVTEFRGRGLATKLLLGLREGENDFGFGILSSHPAAILAALRAFGRGAEEVDHSMAREHAHSIMKSCPVEYVRTAKLPGSILEHTRDGTVSCVGTNFFVDHEEPLEALRTLRAKGITWPYGALTDGYEFLAMVWGNQE